MSKYYAARPRWEGDTFVVETHGFNDDTPIDSIGHPRREDMHVTERYYRRDFGHLETEIAWDEIVRSRESFRLMRRCDFTAPWRKADPPNLRATAGNA